ncbi:MAG: sodium:proton antiporter [Lachnospiraceae bacterium]|nr:sodium:proton antiporter [Lachnospiraceae bacterium]
MNSGIAALESAYTIFFSVTILVIAVLAALCLLRAIIGPRLADRVVAVNMIGTMIIVVVAVLSVMTEGYLADICLIYAMISFLAVIVLTKIYTGAYKQAKVEKTELSIEELDALLEEQKLFPERDLSEFGVVMPEEKEEGGEA